MFRRALAIGTVSILVLTLFIGLAPISYCNGEEPRQKVEVIPITIRAASLILLESVSAGKGPDASPLFDMTFENGTSDYGVSSQESMSLNILVTNTGLTPISVTITTDSPYVAGESSKDTGTILISRESNVIFQFNFGRELDIGEEIRINFTGVITGDPSSASTETLQARIYSTKEISGQILEFQYTGAEEEDKEIRFLAKVKNTGNIPVSIMVKIFKGKDELGNGTASVDVGASEEVEVLWVAKEGKHTFTAKAYAVIGYIAGDSNNPELMLLDEHPGMTLDVESTGLLDEDNVNQYFVIGLVILLIVVAIIAYIKRDKIKKAFKKKKK